mmetsp:Transcript_45194/g.133807  ORF Transcript_45194/g.133807 Transcript_45194/m.133807 type:complete len:1050 (-) Transcript_45194:149-3298(-)
MGHRAAGKRNGSNFNMMNMSKDLGSEVAHVSSGNSNFNGGGNQKSGGRGGGSSTAKVMNVMICKVADRGDFDSLLALVALQGQDLTCVNMSTAVHRLARFVKEDGHVISGLDPRFVALHGKIATELERQASGKARVLPRCLSTFAWAFATMQISDFDIHAAMQMIAELSVLHIDKFNSLELTNLMWGFAKTGCVHAPVFAQVRERLLQDLTSFTTANISTLAWALATSQQHNQEVLANLVDTFIKRIQQGDGHDEAPGRAPPRAPPLKPVELVNIVWSMATANFTPRLKVLSVIGSRVIQNISHFKLQELSITVWSFSRLHARHDKLFTAVAKYLCSSPIVMHQVHTQGIANLLWAFARQKAMGMESGAAAHVQAAVPALVAKCWTLLPQFKPQEFASTLHALDRLGLPWGSCGEEGLFLAEAARAGLALVPRFSGTQCAHLLQAFASLLEGGLADQLPNPEVMVAFLDGLLEQGEKTHLNDLSARILEIRKKLQSSAAKQGSFATRKARKPTMQAQPKQTGADAWQGLNDHECVQADSDHDINPMQDFVVIDDEERFSPHSPHSPPAQRDPAGHDPMSYRPFQAQKFGANAPSGAASKPQGNWSPQGHARKGQHVDSSAYRTNSPVRTSRYEQQPADWQPAMAMVSLEEMLQGMAQPMPGMPRRTPQRMTQGMPMQGVQIMTSPIMSQDWLPALSPNNSGQEWPGQQAPSQDWLPAMGQTLSHTSSGGQQNLSQDNLPWPAMMQSGPSTISQDNLPTMWPAMMQTGQPLSQDNLPRMLPVWHAMPQGMPRAMPQAWPEAMPQPGSPQTKDEGAARVLLSLRQQMKDTAAMRQPGPSEYDSPWPQPQAPGGSMEEEDDSHVPMPAAFRVKNTFIDADAEEGEDEKGASFRSEPAKKRSFFPSDPPAAEGLAATLLAMARDNLAQAELAREKGEEERAASRPPRVKSVHFEGGAAPEAPQDMSEVNPETEALPSLDMLVKNTFIDFSDNQEAKAAAFAAYQSEPLRRLPPRALSQETQSTCQEQRPSDNDMQNLLRSCLGNNPIPPVAGS